MEDNFTALETLLNTDSVFFSNASFNFSKTREGKTLTYKEQIVEACWNGELAEILPEAFCLNDMPYLYLWNAKEYDATVVLESSNTLYNFNNGLSLNPHCLNFNLMAN